MATTRKSATTLRSTDTRTTEGAVSPTRGLNPTPFRLAKKSGQFYLDSYEKALQRVLDVERAAANRSGLDWVTALTNTHTKFVENVTRPYVKIARAALK
jgi:hypothetical protein